MNTTKNSQPHSLGIELANLQIDLTELTEQECNAIGGGMRKLPTAAPPGQLLMTPDGEPVSVYVDGILVNSVRTGFYP